MTSLNLEIAKSGGLVGQWENGEPGGERGRMGGGGKATAVNLDELVPLETPDLNAMPEPVDLLILFARFGKSERVSQDFQASQIGRFGHHFQGQGELVGHSIRKLDRPVIGPRSNYQVFEFERRSSFFRGR
jgi:hypothetical protein